MFIRFLLFINFLVLSAAAAASHREHKVHNIVLYPDKHSWCKTTAINQVISVPGYETVTINNNICVGACFSYNIPFTKPSEPGEIIGPYCDSCQPVDTKCYHVMLKNEKETEAPIRKDIQMITSCNCTTCNLTPQQECETNAPLLPNNYLLNKPQDKATDQVNNEAELLHVTTHDDIRKRLQLKKDSMFSNKNFNQKKLNEFLNSITKKDDDMHYVNERIRDYFNGETGHLIRGPHGSLVMYKDEEKPAINVEVNLLKPNQAGVVLSYDNHIKDGRNGH